MVSLIVRHIFFVISFRVMKRKITTLLIINFLITSGLEAQDNKSPTLFYKDSYYPILPQIKQNNKFFHNRNVLKLKPIMTKLPISSYYVSGIGFKSKLRVKDSIAINQEEIPMESSYRKGVSDEKNEWNQASSTIRQSLK